MTEAGDKGGQLPLQRRDCEQALMRIGRRLQALGQLLEQGPTRLVGKGFEFEALVTGPRPVQIEMDELRAVFDRQAPGNVGQLLAEYHAIIARERGAGRED